MEQITLARGTLLIIPCSGDKREADAAGVDSDELGGDTTNGTSIISVLEPNHATALASARTAIRERAKVDEQTMMAAQQRYAGLLYTCGRSALGAVLSKGVQILILSGGYGLVLANEPIGYYEKRFVLSDWQPRGVLETCLIDYAHREGIQSVIALMSSTTDYGKLIRKVPWRSAGLRATLICPVARRGTGAQGKVPRALGEALDAILAGTLNESWLSSDGLSVKAERLGV